jgi:hypothetical protein
LNLTLTSDLPSTANQMVFDLMRFKHPQPQIYWITSFTRTRREHFPIAQNQISAYGFFDIEYCDIDEKQNKNQLATLE